MRPLTALLLLAPAAAAALPAKPAPDLWRVSADRLPPGSDEAVARAVLEREAASLGLNAEGASLRLVRVLATEPLELLRGDHDDVERAVQVPQLCEDGGHAVGRVQRGRRDDEEVVVALGHRGTPGVRAEQQNPPRRRKYGEDLVDRTVENTTSRHGYPPRSDWIGL